MALEEEFETEIPDEDAEKITTVSAAIDYINSHKGKAEPPLVAWQCPDAWEGARPLCKSS